MTATNEEKGFEIDGKMYPIPTLDSFDIAEARLLWESCGMALEDFATPDEETEEEREERLRRYRHPGFIAALVEVAYARGNPDLRASAVHERCLKLNMLDAMEDMIQSVREGAPDDVPLEPTKPRSESSKDSESSKNDSSGPGSMSGSDAQEDSHAPTGTGLSMPSVPESPARMSAV